MVQLPNQAYTHPHDPAQPPSSVQNGSTQPSPPALNHLSFSPINLDKTSDSSQVAGLPPWIRTASREFELGELQYLRLRGALSIPEAGLRDQLLLAFILYVEPALPVVDLQEVIDAIEGLPGRDISLILFQAIMFSATAFVDLQLLLDAGFQDRLAARTYYFRKVKLLYDFEWEADRIILIQATLLHAWWYLSTNDQKDPWHWLGICISLAVGVGLNQTSVHAVKDAQTRRLWRRIWWTIISRDRIGPVVTRRPLRIMDADINLPPLKFQDFDTRPVRTTIPVLQNCTLVNDCVGKVMLADIFMSQIKILLISGRIVTQLYNLRGFSATGSEWAMWFAPKKKSDLDVACLDRLQAELDHWSDNLNSYCRVGYHCDDSTDALQNKVLRIHTGALKLLHLLAQETLHRPLTFPAGLQQPVTTLGNTEDATMTRARDCVSRAASEMCELARDLREDNLWQFVQPLSVGCIMTAIISLIVEIRLAGMVPAELPDHKYHDCVRSLLALRDVWPVTTGSCIMLNHMATKNQIWYARSLKMLAKPTPIEDTSSYAAPTPGATSEAQSQHLQSPLSLLESSAAPHHQVPVSTSLPHYIDRQPVGNISVPAHFASTYLATMYPFSWTAADFDVFGPSSCRELFTDQDLDAFDLDGVASTGLIS
ncbi:hypothetical protein H2200_003308 [Cladophialophora chaetospira]|uniref:Xylanolytic transcriptional activator regulatory domain-containing protein n=1 Tax=Cladophialophora chaetospira TaxID=386627 RepID=A0AA38XHT6_9EURO|nr:hypothetical protein H2200_003308 [Cladophialophora chaetospira]